MGDEMTPIQILIERGNKLIKKCNYHHAPGLANKIIDASDTLILFENSASNAQVKQKIRALEMILLQVTNRLNGGSTTAANKARREAVKIAPMQPPFWAKLLAKSPRTQEGRQDRIMKVLEHYGVYMAASTIAEHTGDTAHAIEIELPNLVEDEILKVEKFKRGAGIAACNAYRLA